MTKKQDMTNRKKLALLLKLTQFFVWQRICPCERLCTYSCWPWHGQSAWGCRGDQLYTVAYDLPSLYLISLQASNCWSPFNDFLLFVFSVKKIVNSACFRFCMRMSDKTAVNALNSKRMVTFFNEFLITTTSFLNGFASECEDKFFELERKLNKIESNLLIIEDKVSTLGFPAYLLVLIYAF